ncbi:hypothetical protein [Melittangium boletus]|uniref:hypothetical protein n=1 Tax=Melittangium boletus TaxID=83453 RepID=UPI003DA6BE3C
MKRLLLSAAAAALVLSPLACDIQKTGSQLLAEKVMVGTLFSTPDVDISAAALAGLDAGTLPDGGIPEDERITLPGQTATLVFFGTRNGESGSPQPLTDATLRLEANGLTVPLNAQGAGTYGLTSAPDDDAGVRYQSGASYRFVATQQGTSYVGLVEDAPALERLDALHPQNGYVRHTAGQGLTLRRPTVPAGKERTLGFVTVFALRTDGERGESTYSNLPTDPLSLLKLAATPGEWQQPTLEVPGTAFPAPDSNYLVIFQTTRLGGADSENLFYGSTLLVGTADVGLVHTTP